MLLTHHETSVAEAIPEVTQESPVPFFDVEAVGDDAELATRLIGVIEDLTTARRLTGFKHFLNKQTEVEGTTESLQQAGQTTVLRRSMSLQRAWDTFMDAGGYPQFKGLDGAAAAVNATYAHRLWSDFGKGLMGPENERIRGEYMAALRGKLARTVIGVQDTLF